MIIQKHLSQKITTSNMRGKWLHSWPRTWPLTWIVLFGVWLSLLLGLVTWWGYFALSQAKKILELETKLGLEPSLITTHWQNTKRMLLWESSTFFLLIIFTSFVIIHIWIRDQKRAKSVRAFFASFTHELKTPLTGIRLQAESIEESLVKPVKSDLTNPVQNSIIESEQVNNVQKRVERLLQDVTRLESQVETTLELSRLEGGGPLHLKGIPLKLWLDRFVRSYQDHFSKHVQITITGDQLDSLDVLADPTGLQIAFRNLVENSIRHSGVSPVFVAIEVKRNKAGMIHLLISDSGSDSCSGSGAATSSYFGDTFLKNTIHKQALKPISQDSRKLGTLFYKGEHSSGAGVGLFLIKSLIQRMGGSVRYFYGETGGFVCRMTLPEATR